jgi:hypothetical protein
MDYIGPVSWAEWLIYNIISAYFAGKWKLLEEGSRGLTREGRG